MVDTEVTTALEIANTRHGHGADLDEKPRVADEHDHLATPSEAHSYLSSRGLPVPAEPPTADELERMRELRGIARAVAAEVTGSVHRRLDGLLARYTYHLSTDGTLVPVDSGWDGITATALPGLFKLLGAGERLRTCGNPECDWLFVDESRNQSRVWCDMGTCGSRAKMTRYRQRQRKTA